jgi:hypothetical protein
MALNMCAARVLLVVGVLCAPMNALAQTARDGARDFDWEIGAWDTHVRVRPPFSTDEDWAEFRGGSLVHSFSDGGANIVDLDVANASGAIRGVSLRLYNPEARQWSLHFASARDGVLTAPLYGSFENGRGMFYGQDMHEGRAVFVRFVISDITETSARFVQSYSADGGRTWIDNWVAVDRRRR